jgi:hypothetical protein
MKNLGTAATTFAVMALAATPIGVASANNSQAGQDGNHCGYLYAQQHAHSPHHGGLKVGQHCNKVHQGGGENNGDDEDSGDDTGQ